MKNYLSFGGGVNSVALYLLLTEQQIKFEAVFVDHGTDWPETYEYVDRFKQYIYIRGFPNPLTIIKPDVQGYSNLYDYFWWKQSIPYMRSRDCSHKFKSITLEKYYNPPGWINIGMDFGEINRASLSSKKGFEYRYPIIEAEMNRNDCINLIKKYDIETPIKSGCFICPFQKRNEWKKLRIIHPDLFCKAEQLENRHNERRKKLNKKPSYINILCSVRSYIEEDQYKLFKRDEYPPCECML